MSSTDTIQSNPKTHNHTSIIQAASGTANTSMTSCDSPSISESEQNTSFIDPSSHISTLCSNDTMSLIDSSRYEHNKVREAPLTNQTSISYCQTTVSRELPHFQQSPDDIHYYKHSSTSISKFDNASLLLLAKCATMTSTTDYGMQSYPSATGSSHEVSNVSNR